MSFKIFHGDCLETLKNAPDNSIDSIVTDPPYGLSFMGKRWDYDVPSVEIWKECLRVLKPGGHLLAFGGTRTYHRLVVAIEDAGFEIRDQIQWIYGQGFPKSQDISKAIDKAAGAEREVLGLNPSQIGRKTSNMQSFVNTDEFDGAGEVAGQRQAFLTAPATPEAKQWSGWGTALKPANEPICLARKPLSESTIAKNVLKHGTGGLNIDGTRIGADIISTHGGGDKYAGIKGNGNDGVGEYREHVGRFPSNVILDEDAAKVLDGQSGPLKFSYATNEGKASSIYGSESKSERNVVNKQRQTETGGASRFFYVAKASKSDRGADNTHPTVKPIKLMEYLIKLVTPEGGKVLDPFMGSGTTGVAALRNGFEFRGIEREEQYYYIAQARLEKETKDVV